ncbi:MAG: hypothetical protein J7L57_00300 [Deltaproteobacteria bacterium]|nr:hypothetical protein [Candidatus Tharpella sp.]
MRVAPPLVPNAVLFDHYQEKKFIGRLYYQQVNDRLIFACTTYLYPGKRDRIIITFTRDICAMPADFMTLPQEQFDQLLACQHDWQQRLSLLAAQL